LNPAPQWFRQLRTAKRAISITVSFSSALIVSSLRN
jgi:hypothetical protein